MRRILIIASLLLSTMGYGQISGYVCAQLTQYTNNNPNDSIYLYSVGTLGELLATPTGGTGPYTFAWNYFNLGIGSWMPYFTETTPNTSHITNLEPGAYNVIITDASGTTVGCDNAWIVQYLTNEVIGGGLSIDLFPIEPSCTSVNLSGVIDITPPWSTGGFSSGYSNLPPNPMFVDPNTQINVCFSGTHSWVSDIAFYLVGPASCGSPTVVLSPNPGAIGQGSVCNSGNNISNLCFSTESTNNLNVCTAGAPLSGTYGTYGLSSTAPNWSAFYGCETTNAGWAVQIYDCIGGDTGSLTDATLTFTGLSGCGGMQTITYSTPPGYSSFIADNSCSASTASIFSVPPITVIQPISCDVYAEISAEPYLFIADSLDQITSFPYSFNMTITNPMLSPSEPAQWQNFDFTLSLTSDCEGTYPPTGPSCGNGGGDTNNTSDTESFVFIPWEDSFIAGPIEVCQYVGLVEYVASHPGQFTGPFVDPTGIFDPLSAGIGIHTISFIPDEPCVYPSSLTVQVIPNYTPTIFPVGNFCVDAAPIVLAADMAGSFGGPGTTPFGLFDPAAAGVGVHAISFDASDVCGGSATLIIEVYALPVVTVSPDAQVCFGLPYALNATGASTYTWSPVTYLSSAAGSLVNSSPTADVSYTVVGTDDNGCANSASVSLEVLPLPEITTTPVGTSCPGAGVSISATGSPGSYQWEPATGLATPTASTTNVTIFETATYTVTVTDNCGLTATDDVVVPIDPELTINTGSDLVYCELESVNATAVIDGDFHTLEWTTPNGMIDPSDVNQLTITIATPGSYVLTATTLFGCAYQDGLTVVEIPLPQLNMASPLLLCPNGTVQLNAGSNWDQVLWDNGSTQATQDVDQPGLYDVTVIDNNCTNFGTVEVIAITLPYLELGNDVSICVDDEVTFSIAEAGQWSDGSFSDAFTTSQPGTYGVTIVDGPCSVTDSVSVTTRPLPFVDMPDEVVGCVDQAVVLTASHPYNSSYFWSTEDTGPTILVYESGLYTVDVANDCGSISDQTYVSYEDCSYTIYLPNTFTPDQDGINDVWKIESFNIAKMHFELFNRYGEMVVQTEDPFFTWTGEVKEGTHYSPDGLYHYRLSYESTEGDVGTRKGIVFLVR